MFRTDPWSDLTITAGASDASGISRVDFFSGTNFIGSDTNATAGTNYSIAVRGLKPGQYTLTLHKSGRFLTSAPAILMVWTDFSRE